MNAFCSSLFCTSPLLRASPSRANIVPHSRSVTIPFAKASKPPHTSRNKRPRTSRTAGFGASNTHNNPTTSSNSFSSTESTQDISNDNADDNQQNFADDNRKGKGGKAAKSKGKRQKKAEEADERARELTKLDSRGISMEHRLREEILHPLRKPKLTLFGTLAFSATLGFFFACARRITEKDSLSQVSTNVAIDVAAVVLFGYLAWREYEFGRRSLNSIAGIPQPRDLPIIRLDSSNLSSQQEASSVSNRKNRKASSPSSPINKLWNQLSNQSNDDDGKNSDRTAEATGRLGALLKHAGTVVIMAGRAVDVARYIERCARDAGYNDPENNPPLASKKYDSKYPALVAFITDGKEGNAKLETAVTAVAAGSSDEKADWVAWLADAVPPRRNITLFRIEKENGGRGTASEYIVTVDDPDVVPLPEDARRLTVVEV